MKKQLRFGRDFLLKKGITDERVFYYGNENWWSRVGEPANMSDGEPGGPDSEVFYDLGCGDGRVVFYAAQNFSVKSNWYRNKPSVLSLLLD